MQRGMPDEPGEYAGIGTVAHKALENNGDTDLSGIQERAVSRAMELEKWAVEQWAPIQLREVHREVRLWARDSKLRLRHSGKLDAFWISADGRRAFIEDFKALFGDVALSPTNLQLRDEAALLWENYPEAEEVTVWINQPLVHWRTEDQVFTTYGLDDLNRAHSEMMARVERSHDPRSPRIPGPVQCKFCRARLVCPEAREFGLSVVERGKLDLDEMTPAERGELLPKFQAVVELAENYLEYFKRHLETNPDYVTGYWLKPGRVKHPITDPQKCYENLVAHVPDVMPTEFADACTVGKVKLEKLVKEKTHLKGRELTEKLHTILADCTAEKQDRPSLARKDEKAIS